MKATFLYLWLCLCRAVTSLSDHDTRGDTQITCPTLCRCDTRPSLTVDCSNSPLGVVPVNIPHDTEILDLRNTGLSEIQPRVLSRLENLKELYVGRNNIRAFHVDSLAGLSTLLRLDLSPINFDMNIDYEAFPPSLFRDLTSLEVLVFGVLESSGASIQHRYIDRTIAPLHRLQQLTLGRPPTDNVGFGPGYSNLTSLKTLVFYGQSPVAKMFVRKHAFVWLENCPIERLAFIDCGIGAVESGTMSSFQNLKILDVECSSFISVKNVEDFICDLNKTSIETLRMKSIFERQNGLAPVSQWTLSARGFDCLRNGPHTLELIDDRITGVDMNIIKHLSRVKYLDLSHNNILRIYVNGVDEVGIWPYFFRTGLLNLTFFRIENNVIYSQLSTPPCGTSHSFWYDRPTLPLSPAKHKESLYVPSSSQEVLTHGSLLKMSLPENLEFISVSWWPQAGNGKWQSSTYYYAYIYPNKLRYLRMSGLSLRSLNITIYGLDRLEYLDFSHNKLDFFPKDFFNHYPSLEFLMVSDNRLGPLIAKGVLYQMKLPNIKTLDLSQNRISTIPKDFFDRLTSLRLLDLSVNRIGTVSFSIENCLSIEYINLSTNQLQAFTKKELELVQMNSTTRVALNMTGNPLDCSSCDGEDFLRWVTYSNITITFTSNSSCSTNGSKPGHNSILDRLHKECHLMERVTASTNHWLSLAISSAILTCMTCGLIVAYLYRWNIKYRFYLLRRRFRKRGFAAAAPGHVYASYDDRDYRWVTGVLLRHLEEELNLDAIIDDRDFIGGASLAEAIVEAVDNSRKTVLALSEAYVQNPWCEFEFQMSLARGYHSVIPVMIQVVPVGTMSKSLRKYIKARGYIKWTENPEGQRLFWNRLSDAIFADGDTLVQRDELDLTEMM